MVLLLFCFNVIWTFFCSISMLHILPQCGKERTSTRDTTTNPEPKPEPRITQANPETENKRKHNTTHARQLALGGECHVQTVLMWHSAAEDEERETSQASSAMRWSCLGLTFAVLSRRARARCMCFNNLLIHLFIITSIHPITFLLFIARQTYCVCH